MKKDKTMMHVGIGVAIFALLMLLIPAQNGLTPIGVAVLSIFAATIYLWISVGTGWPSLMCILAMILTGVTTPTAIWAASFGSWLIPFLIFCFMFSIALSETGFMKRFITWFITRKFVENKPWAFITMLLIGEYVVGLFIDCTAAAVFVLPLCVELFEMIGSQKEDKLVKTILIGSISALILSTLATPIGHVIPVMYIGYALSDHGVVVSLFQYTACAFPACTAAFALMIVYLRFIVKPDVSKLKNYNIDMAKKSLPPKSKQETIVASAYIAAIICWLVPDLTKGFMPSVAAWFSTMGYAVPAGLALTVLFIIRVDKKPILNYVNLFSKVNWNTIILVCSMNTLNAVVTNASTGVSVWLSNVMTPMVSVISAGILVAAVAVIWDTVQTNFMSCFATGQIVYTAMVPIVVAFPALGVSPVALTLLIGMCCGYGALMPQASGPPSILLSTDWCTPADSMKITPPLILIFILTSTFIAYPLFEKLF